MGIGDKLKELREQAQQAVAENRDKIQDAVQVVGDVANTRTNGKYANKIGKVGMKVEQGIDRFAEGTPAGEDTAASEGAAPAQDASPAPVADEPAKPVTPSADTAGGDFPEFE